MTRRALLAWALVACAAPGTAPAAVDPTPRCVVVDVGARAAPAPLRAAVEAAVAASTRVRPHPDATLRAALRGEEPPRQRWESARTALAAAATAYGALKCEEALVHAERAVDLLEAEAGAAPVHGDLRRAVVYLLLCRDARGDRAGAAAAAGLLRGLTPAAVRPAPGVAADGGVAPDAVEAPPPGVAPEVWRRYPAAPAAGPGYRYELRSEPPGAHVLVDLQPAGITPLAVDLAGGRHRLVVWRPGHVSWRRQVEVSRGGVVFEVTLAPAAPDPHDALRSQARGLAARPKGERAAAAVRLGREAGAARVLAIDAHGGRLRAQLFDVAAGAARGSLFEADARALVARPTDLTVFLDGAAVAAAPASGPASRPAAPARAKLGSKWWHWVAGAAAVAALGVAIWQSEKSSDQVTIRVVKP